MNINHYIGKNVIVAQTKARCVLSEITSPYIKVRDMDGRSFIYLTINGDPIKNGVLVCEDTSLTASFIAAYDAYCRSKQAYYEEIGYWMRQD